MARETEARAPCDRCGREVAVKRNVSGKAYYNCDHCGFHGRDTWQRSSDAYMAKIGAAKAPAPAPAPSPSPSPSNQPAPARRGAGTILG